MADIKVTVPAEVVDRVLDAFAAMYRFDPENEDGVTKAAFAKNCVATYVKEVVKAHEANIAVEAARKQAADKADAEIGVT